ncbi:GNAT family N-acetyltransferase [Aliivibrio finisterrensis]|uniref:GNAT family N-acetyltransferase n=1 Tax=Aliivibrio finisterrensis TaxID=511998 RepID=A0A4Q5KDF7_9GAMM|nr:GNAT family N-acetyltransferase [Aliivibrio finisterrensis]RYU44051.1 GNAT family N-acetyltransferase [Aliivibrio finisterrensis]
MNIEFYTEDKLSIWDSFVAKSHKATFQHSRTFLNYHRDRFIDRSVIVYDGNKLLAIFPAAETPYNSEQVVSHIGSTYGGLICDASVYGNNTIEILQAIVNFYQDNGYKEIVYKATPSIYHSTTDEDEVYALFRLNARLNRVDINAVVDKYARLKVSSQRKRSYKKAIKASLTVQEGFENIEAFYSILLSNLESKHGAKPVHTIDELKELKQLFPNDIYLWSVITTEGQVIAGVLFFFINQTMHAQYITSSPNGYDLGALDFLFESALSFIEPQEKLRYFAFGTSNEEQGKILNQTLYRFKRQFGAGSVAHQFYSLV